MSSHTKSHLVGVVVVLVLVWPRGCRRGRRWCNPDDEAVTTAMIRHAKKTHSLGGTGGTSGTINTTTSKASFGVFDAHLHLTGRTPSQSGADLVDELRDAGVDGGLLYAVYGPYNPDYGSPAVDANEEVERIISSGGRGRIFGLASLNTSDWNDDGDIQLSKLRDYLDRPGFVGAKLAPPHTCLSLDGPKMTAVLETVSNHHRSNQTSIEEKKNKIKMKNDQQPQDLPPLQLLLLPCLFTPARPLRPTGAYATALACCEDEYAPDEIKPSCSIRSRLQAFTGLRFHPRFERTSQNRRCAATVYPRVYREVSAMFTREKTMTRTRQVVLHVLVSRTRRRKYFARQNPAVCEQDEAWKRRESVPSGVERTLRLTVAPGENGFAEEEVPSLGRHGERSAFIITKQDENMTCIPGKNPPRITSDTIHSTQTTVVL